MSIGQNTTIFVGGFDDLIITETNVYNLFIVFGEIRSVLLEYNKTNTKIHAFVEYEDHEDCLHSIENMDGYDYKGKYLKVTFSRNIVKKNNDITKPVWLNENYFNAIEENK